MVFNLTYPNFNFAHKIDEIPQKDDEFNDHFHMIYEIFLFVRGDAKFIIENRKFVLHPGDVLFIPPGHHHCVKVNQDTPYERYVIKFPEYEIPKHLLSAVKNKSGAYTAEHTAIRMLFERLDSHVAFYKGVDLCGLLKCVLREILYYSCNNSSLYEFEINNENINGLIDYINVNLAKKITLDDICKNLHYSKSSICKEFQQYMKVPVMQYIRTKKILLADSLIKTGAKPMEIYEQCGFLDYTTFFRAYQRILGTTPSPRKHERRKAVQPEIPDAEQKFMQRKNNGLYL